MTDNNYRRIYDAIEKILQLSRRNIITIEENGNDIENKVNWFQDYYNMNNENENNEVYKKNEEEDKLSDIPFCENYGIEWSVLDDDKLGKYSTLVKLTGPYENKIAIFQILKKNYEETYNFLERWGEINLQGQLLLYNGILTNGTKITLLNLFYSKFSDVAGYPFSGNLYNEEISRNNLLNGINGNYLNCNDVYNVNSELKIHETVRGIVEKIFNTENMASVLREMNCDFKKIQLNYLSKEDASFAYKCLRNIEEFILSRNEYGLKNACNIYNQIIPRSNVEGDFFKVIETIDDLEKEEEFLNTLLEIQYILKIIENEKQKVEYINNDPIDIFYKNMKCKIELLSLNNYMRNIIIDIFHDIQLSVDTFSKIRIKNIFEIIRKPVNNEQIIQVTQNKRILWYAFKITNWYNIFFQNVCILPKDSYGFVSMLKNGVCIFDVSSKLSNDFYATSGQTEFFGLAESTIAMTFNNPKQNNENLKTSVNEEGVAFSEESNTNCLSDNFEDLEQYSNKYIINDKEQICIRYLIEIENINTESMLQL
ncbi:Poly [ADP-ribose] polymerase 2 [Strongyloides ratti]|uniref:Poly [ADP-ribose] polymerase 2 n=1 Tax=Strongyloides ratti TaxID=34506 RepID=A0A090MUR1_STRRB|nr:Poly [ADP-ribose] polymerase 2 [Strongyloides ratti]CEF62378.1 Poly [ADP-ribose] polymerase 2 [Strongyloides ratti]